MRSAVALAIIIGVSTTSANVDRLVSKRHQKRFVDEAGLYVHDILPPPPESTLIQSTPRM